MRTRERNMEAGLNGRAGTRLPAAARQGLRALPPRLCVFAVMLMIGMGALAQYAIEWHTIDGGGGTSTNEKYSVSGCIGQLDAGPRMTNGQYSVTGGFWALPAAVQTEGAPMLTIIPAGESQAQISWTPATGINWVLQERANLTTGSWNNSPSGTNNPTVVPVTLPAKFYRLHKP